MVAAAATASCCADTTVGGGHVLDPQPPRQPIPLGSSGSSRGEAPVYAPVEGPDGWRYSSEWLEELRVSLEAALDATDPLDPGVPAPTEAWAKDVLPQLPFERRGSMLYRPGAAGELGKRAAEAAVVEAALAAAEPGAAKIEQPELARFLESDGQL